MKASQLMLFIKMIVVDCWDRMTQINTPLGQNSDFLNVTIGGTYFISAILKG
jgi:hypothetical protein